MAPDAAGMTRDDGDEPFALTVVDVFTVSRRGTAVVGPIESGTLRTGDRVRVVRGDVQVATAEVSIEMICSRDADPRTIGLLIRRLDGATPQPGDLIRNP